MASQMPSRLVFRGGTGFSTPYLSAMTGQGELHFAFSTRVSMVTSCGGIAALFISVRDRSAGVLGAADIHEMTSMGVFSWCADFLRS